MGALTSTLTFVYVWPPAVVPLHTAGSFWFSLLLPNTVQTATSQMATSRKRLSSILVSMRLSWELSSRCTYVLTCWSCLVPGQLLEFCWPQGRCKTFNPWSQEHGDFRTFGILASGPQGSQSYTVMRHSMHAMFFMITCMHAARGMIWVRILVRKLKCTPAMPPSLSMGEGHLNLHRHLLDCTHYAVS